MSLTLRSVFLLPVLLWAGLLAGCAAPPVAERAGVERPAADDHALILISLDGFRHDYRPRTDTPTLDRLVAEGVRAERFIPVFPTLTFPNHYSVVTGLHPERHGIVGNTIYDPEFDATFSMGNQVAVTDGRWWGGEPIWVTAERQGRHAATLFWPGSEAEIGGVRPSTWLPYDGGMPHEARVDSVLAWLDRPIETRPAFLTLYFSEIDSRGHSHGPDAPETTAAIANVDRALAQLVAGLEARGIYDTTDIVIVSDHGMAELSPERVVFIDDYIDMEADVERMTWGATAGLWPRAGRAEAVVAALAEASHMQAWHRQQVPERFHFRDHRRIAPVVLLADEGWTLTTRENHARRGAPSGGTHGYDNRLDSMAGIFIARGPSFRSEGAVVDEVHAVDVYEIMTNALGLEPAPNQGNPAALDQVMTSPAP